MTEMHKNRKTHTKPKDKHKPQESPSAYLLFSNEVRPSVRAKHGDKSSIEVAKAINKQWNAMTQKQKQPYHKHAALMREESAREFAKYKMNEWKYTQTKYHQRKSSTKCTKTPQRTNSNSNHNDAYDSDSSLSSDLSDPIFQLGNGFEGVESKTNSTPKRKPNAMTIAEAILNTSQQNDRPHVQPAIAIDLTHSTDEDESEEKEDTLRCKMCLEPFDDMNSLEQHEKLLHIKQCTQCELKFRTMTCLDEHMYSKHDVYATDAMEHNDDRMRVDQYGTFKMNDSIAKQRFIYNNSRYRQTQRIRQQMAAITDRIVVDKDHALLQRKNQERVRVHTDTYSKKKRNNAGNSINWTTDDTTRFYLCLRYTGMNWTFLEVLYNGAISNADCAKLETDTLEDDGQEMKKEKNRVYRDAKALHQKYRREENNNNNVITKIVKCARFTKAISDKVAELVKQNDFKLKDEEYYADSDEELLVENKEGKKGNENTFDPLIECVDEIEEDTRQREEIKRVERERLDAWRTKKEMDGQERMMEFRQEYEEYQRSKEQGMIHNDTMNTNEEEIQPKEGDDESIVGDSFDPFATLLDDCDDPVNRNGSSELNCIQKGNYDDHYQSDDILNFDIDADPFD
eukprot:421470_1